MTRRIFLDVGANTGQSLAVALGFDFDRIVCFEPAPQCWAKLEGFADDQVPGSVLTRTGRQRVTVARFGLSNTTAKLRLYEPGRKGASMWRKGYAGSAVCELCDFRRASEWFAKNIKADDCVWLKLNCEGAECDILEDLLDSGEFAKVTHALVLLHSVKVPELVEREEALVSRLAQDTRVCLAYRMPLERWLLRTTT